MNKILLLDTQLSSVWVYPESKIVHHLKKGYCYGADLREALSRGLDAMIRYKTSKWLSDNRASSAVPKEDEEWAATQWFPRMLAAGWKHWAIVQPAKVIGQITAQRHAKAMPDFGVNARMFADPDEALAWLVKPEP